MSRFASVLFALVALSSCTASAGSLNDYVLDLSATPCRNPWIDDIDGSDWQSVGHVPDGWRGEVFGALEVEGDTATFTAGDETHEFIRYGRNEFRTLECSLRG